jgi:hypothetical protein
MGKLDKVGCYQIVTQIILKQSYRWEKFLSLLSTQHTQNVISPSISTLRILMIALGVKIFLNFTLI